MILCLHFQVFVKRTIKKRESEKTIGAMANQTISMLSKLISVPFALLVKRNETTVLSNRLARFSDESLLLLLAKPPDGTTISSSSMGR